MRNAIIEKIEQRYMKPDLPDVAVGDNVDVHVRIVEGDKERVQVFSGVVIAIKGAAINQSIVVRRIVANEGVERTFPLHSPKVAKIEVTRHAHTRRSKLYFLRDRIGKARRLRDRRRDLDRAVVGPAARKAARDAAAQAAAQGPAPDEAEQPTDAPQAPDAVEAAQAPEGDAAEAKA